jgi:hypothetical protein
MANTIEKIECAPRIFKMACKCYDNRLDSYVDTWEECIYETREREGEAAKNALAPVFTNLVAFLLSEYSANWKGSVMCRLDRIFGEDGEVDIAGRMIMANMGYVKFELAAKNDAKSAETIMPVFAQIAYRIRIGYYDVDDPLN